MQRLMGAAAFGGVSRQVFVFGDDPESDDKFQHVMGFGRPTNTPSLRYKTEAHISDVAGKPSEVIQVRWLGEAKVAMDDVINAAKDSDKTILAKAADIVHRLLRSGSKKKAELEQAVKENGIDPTTITWSKIKRRCKAESRPCKGKSAGYEWYIETAQQEEIFDVDQPKLPQSEVAA